MRETTLHRIIALLAGCVVAAVLAAAAPSLAQQSNSPWILAQAASGGTEVSARSEIAAPQGAGFAILRILHRAGGKPSVIVYLTIESPEELTKFPFDKYDGPVEKTKTEFIEFEVLPGRQGAASSVKVMPNGYYAVDPSGAFVFDTIDKSVVAFLSHVRDGQKLTVMVNGHPSSIRVVFDTTGLKKLLDQMGL